MADIKLNHIFKVYPNGVKAVNDFCLDITNEEFIVFVGPSGCGKSTTLRMIAGLEEITAGQLYIGDRYCNELEPKDRDIAMVFQNYALYPHMTVYDNMAFGLVNRKMDKEEIKKRVTYAANVLGLTDYLDRKPKEMSGGQCQRVALGRAIVRNPKVFLLDEPLSNLDAKLRATMRTEIAKLHQEIKTTFIYVTHDQVEAMTMGDRIVVMKDGYVQQIDTPKNLFKYPKNKFVAGFIGTPQMNFFNVTISEDKKLYVLHFKDAEFDIPFDKDYLMTIDPIYLDGIKPIVLGVRSEHISTSEIKGALHLKCLITQLEDLGTETLVYGDINIKETNNQVIDSDLLKTKVVFKSNDEFNHKVGEIVDIYIDVNRIHLFDEENEVTINQIIPDHSRIKASISEGIINIKGNTISFPYSREHFEAGIYEMFIPTDAISLGEQIEGKIAHIINKDDKKSLYIKLDNDYLYLPLNNVDSYKVGESIKLDIDITKVDFYLSNELKYMAIDNPNEIIGKLKLDKTIENNVKGKSLHYHFLNNSFKVDSELAYRSFVEVNDKRIFKLDYKFAFLPDKIHIADEGVAAKVIDLLDYGKDKFIKCLIADKEVIIRTETNIKKDSVVNLKFDVDEFNVYNASNDVKLI